MRVAFGYFCWILAVTLAIPLLLVFALFFIVWEILSKSSPTVFRKAGEKTVYYIGEFGEFCLSCMDEALEFFEKRENEKLRKCNKNE